MNIYQFIAVEPTAASGIWIAKLDWNSSLLIAGIWIAKLDWNSSWLIDWSILQAQLTTSGDWWSQGLAITASLSFTIDSNSRAGKELYSPVILSSDFWMVWV